ncbi:MAG: TonB-dependent receptor, partial [Desulfobacterales bacterium]|nr:TonB-dependent receptor [Desulfobacterales bacterium]
LYRAEQETLSGPPSAATGLARVEKDSFALYVNDELSLMENFILSLGARRERAKYDLSQKSLPAGTVTLQDTVREREYAYSAGLTFLYGDQSSLFARANRSLRFPLTDELVETDQSTFLTRINSDLMPQKGRHYDVGIRHRFSTRLSGSFTLFRAEIKDEILYDPTPAPFFGTNVNHPETLHQGLEIGSKARIHDRFELLANYTYTKATFEKDPFQGKDIPAVPRHKVNLGLRVIDIIPGLIFAADYNYVGSSFLISDQANGLAKLDDYYTIDTRLSYSWKRVSAFVGLNNLTNQEYAQYGVAGGGGTTRNFYPAPERNWIGGLEIVF